MNRAHWLTRTFALVVGLTALIAIAGAPPIEAAEAALLTAPTRLHGGGRSAATIVALDAATRAPLDRPVTLELVSPDGDAGEEATRETLFSGRTGEKGQVRAEFAVPDIPTGSYRIRAVVGGVERPVEVAATLVRTPAILIETDKPIYKPSQTIRGRIVLLDNALRPRAGRVELTFHDAKGIRIDRKILEADGYGAAAFSLDLASEVNFGTWKLRASSDGAESARDVRVEEYVLPRYELELDLAKSWALVDEPIAGSVSARYFFGKDVEGAVRVTAKRWVATWEEYAEVTGTLAAGRLDFTLPPVGFVSGTPGAAGQGTVTLEATVTDATGHEQEVTDVVTISEAPAVLTLVSRTRDLKAEVPGEVILTSKAPDGIAVDVEADLTARFYSAVGSLLDEQRGPVRTVGGRGAFDILPPRDTAWADVTAAATVEGKTATASVRIDGAYSPSGDFISLLRVDGDGPATVGQTLTFSAASSRAGTVYYEVYAGGRTVLSDAADGSEFSFPVTPEMAPGAKVVAYKINPDNEVAADGLALEVRLDLGLTVETDFGAGEVRPGDPVRLRIDAGTGRRTLLGVSLVDRSVLALGRSRLHMADVFAELERRFLEPQVEVHEGADPGGDPWGQDPWGPPMADGPFFRVPRTRGAYDVLGDAGLSIAASEGISVPRGGEIDFWRWAEDAGGLPPPAAGGDPNEGSSGPEPPVRVRQFFPETWVWEPLLLTDEDGTASLELTAPDSITGWKLAVVGTVPADGPGGGAFGEGIVFGEDELTVFQEFFVEPSLPYSAVRGELFPVKVDVFNYLEAPQTVAIDLEGSDAFALEGDGSVSVDVPAGSATSVAFPIRPVLLGEIPIKLVARGSSRSDAVLRTLLVIPEGNPVENVVNGVIEAGTSVPLDVSIPPFAVSGSGRAWLHVTPSPVAQTMDGVADLLGMPYGCGEQNMIFLAPDIEILKYLRETGEISPEVRATAEYYVNVGYQRQLTFRSDDGGFAAFGGEEGSIWLTAFVLSTFAGAREVRDIDEAVLAAAAAMIVSRQNPDGSFQTDDFLIHKEMDGGMENVYSLAAFVTNALADHVLLAPGGASPPAEVEAALERAADYLAGAWRTIPEVEADPYSLALGAVALLRARAAEAEPVIDSLLALAERDGVGIHWKPYPVETTGYAAMALMEANGGAGRPEAAAAVEWLSTQRNALGGYGGSTQDTVVAIRALFLAARKVHRDLDVTLTVRAGGTDIGSVRITEANYDLFHQMELPLGDPEIDAPEPLELVSEGRGNVGYQVVRRYNVPGDLLPPPRDMHLEVVYDSSHIEVDDLVDVRVELAYTGAKKETSMVIADIGVPTGFAAVRSTLDALVEAGIASRIETAGRKVIVYIESLAAGTPVRFSFQVRALYPVRAAGTVSRVYEYYDPEVEAFDGVGAIVIHERPSEPGVFIRGDSNDDGRADISDAVTTLEYLFSGGFRPRCLSAADANDDGAVNITDPIHLLLHLFLGGPPPEAPYPEPGLDPTPDALGC